MNILELLDQIVDRKPGRARARHEFADNLIEPPAALGVIPLDFQMAYKSTGALVGLDDASNLKLPIAANNCVRVHGEVDGELAYGGKLVAALERSGRDTAGDLIDDLAVDRDAAMEVEPEPERFLLAGSRHRDIMY